MSHRAPGLAKALPPVFWKLTGKQSVAERLPADPLLSRSDIPVDADDGIARLTGTAGTKGVKRAAEREAYQVPGVERVYDNMNVYPSADRSDVEITADIKTP